MRKPILLFFLLLFGGVALAQETPKKTFVTDTYNRNSLSVVIVKHGDGADQKIEYVVSRAANNPKYDMNRIPTTVLNSARKRGNGKEDREARIAEIDALVEQAGIGKQVISYWFDRKSDGTMDVERVLERGMYDATDADLIRAQATKIGMAGVGDRGFSLIADSYVLVVDYTKLLRRGSSSGYTNWEAAVEAYLYRVDYTPELEARIFACWIYPEDTPEERERKNRMFDELEIPVKRVLIQTGKGQDSSAEYAANDAYGNMMMDLENSEENLLVKSAVVGTHPVRAKIGTKEGVKNGKLFFAYQYREDSDGRVYSKKKGAVRATTVADNRHVATGDSPTSSFYQIAGGTIDPGFILRQKNDLGMGVGVGYRAGGFQGALVQLDWLARINDHGISQYVTADIAYFPYDASGDAGLTSALNFGIGYAVGFRFLRILELKLNASVGADILVPEHKESDDEDLTIVTFVPSAVLNVNIAYPVQLFLGADYGVRVVSGDPYKRVEAQFSRPRGGFGLFGGLRIIL